jgi:hypothetical protein
MGKVKSALAYPLFMIIVGSGVVLFILSFVLPSVTKQIWHPRCVAAVIESVHREMRSERYHRYEFACMVKAEAVGNSAEQEIRSAELTGSFCGGVDNLRSRYGRPDASSFSRGLDAWCSEGFHPAR